jgi:hypothetical protein
MGTTPSASGGTGVGLGVGAIVGEGDGLGDGDGAAVEVSAATGLGEALAAGLWLATVEIGQPALTMPAMSAAASTRPTRARVSQGRTDWERGKLAQCCTDSGDLANDPSVERSTARRRTATRASVGT